MFIQNGHIFKQDYNKVKEYYEQAIELANSDEMFNLGVLHENAYGVKQDYNKYKEHYVRAFELGNSNAIAYLRFFMIDVD